MIRTTDVNPDMGRATQPNTAQLSASLRVGTTPQKRIAVVGNGNIDVGNQTPTRKPGQPIVQGSNGSAELRIDPALKKGRASTNPARNCGAMSQQGGEFRGNVSAPQKLVHLVGCREGKAGPVVARRRDTPIFQSGQTISQGLSSGILVGSRKCLGLLDEFTAFLNRGIGRPPRHDRYRGRRVFRRTFDQPVRIDHVDQHVALGVAATDDLHFLEEQ